jgi:hypothetical protein
VAFCDDSRWQAGALTRAADLLDAHPGLASVTARILVEPDLREDPLTPELRHSPVPGPVAGLPWVLRERRMVPPGRAGPAPARGAAAPLPGPPLRRLTWGGRGSAGAGLGVRGGHRLGLG